MSDDQKPGPSTLTCALVGLGGAVAVVGVLHLIAGKQSEKIAALTGGRTRTRSEEAAHILDVINSRNKFWLNPYEGDISSADDLRQAVSDNVESVLGDWNLDASAPLYQSFARKMQQATEAALRLDKEEARRLYRLATADFYKLTGTGWMGSK